MKSALYASVALACLTFAAPVGAAEQPSREPAARLAQSETKSQDAVKPETAPGRRPAGAAERPASPEEGKGPAMRSDKPGGGERGAEAPKPEQRPASAGEQREHAPKAAETKPERGGEKANRSGDNDDRAAQGKPGRGKDAASQDKARSGATAAGEESRDKTRPDMARPDKAQTDRGDARPGERSGDRMGAGERPRMDDTQRSKVSAYFNSHRGPRVDRPNFGVEVGVRVPTRVRVAPLPRQIVEIVPEYRGYDYVMVENEIVIIQPRTREIVTVIPSGGVSSSARTTKLDPCGNRS